MLTIPKALKAGTFTRAKAEQHGLNRYHLYRYLNDGILERVERGVYRVPQADYDDEDTFRAAILRVGEKSAICLMSALIFYNLTDEIPQKTWVMVEQSKRSKHQDLQLIRVAKPQWELGVESHSGYQITSLERTLVDALLWKRHLGPMFGIQCLKRALGQKKTTLSKVVNMAAKLGVLERIQAVIEVLAS